MIEEVVEAQDSDDPADDPQCNQDIIQTELVVETVTETIAENVPETVTETETEEVMAARDKSDDYIVEPKTAVSEELVEEVAASAEKQTLPMERVHVLEPEKEKNKVLLKSLPLIIFVRQEKRKIVLSYQ